MIVPRQRIEPPQSSSWTPGMTWARRRRSKIRPCVVLRRTGSPRSTALP